MNKNIMQGKRQKLSFWCDSESDALSSIGEQLATHIEIGDSRESCLSRAQSEVINFER